MNNSNNKNTLFVKKRTKPLQKPVAFGQTTKQYNSGERSKK